MSDSAQGVLTWRDRYVAALQETFQALQRLRRAEAPHRPALERQRSPRPSRSASFRSKSLSSPKSPHGQDTPTQLSVRRAPTQHVDSSRGRPPRPPSPSVAGKPAVTPMSERNRSKSLPSRTMSQSMAPGLLQRYSSTDRSRGSCLDGVPGNLPADSRLPLCASERLKVYNLKKIMGCNRIWSNSWVECG
jgi:hypothetical protein